MTDEPIDPIVKAAQDASRALIDQEDVVVSIPDRIDIEVRGRCPVCSEPTLRLIADSDGVGDIECSNKDCADKQGVMKLLDSSQHIHRAHYIRAGRQIVVEHPISERIAGTMGECEVLVDLTRLAAIHGRYPVMDGWYVVVIEYDEGNGWPRYTLHQDGLNPIYL